MAAETRNPKRLQWLLHAIGWILHPAIACFEFSVRGGKADLQLAIWLWHNDPDPVRRKATAMCYLVTGGQRIALRSNLLLGLMVFVLLATGFALGRIQLLFAYCMMVILITAGLSFLFTATMGMVAMFYAFTKRVPLWIEETTDPEYAETHWPPVQGKSNQVAIFSLPSIGGILMVGVMVVPEKWMYHAAAGLLLFVPLILWLAHRVHATTVEECYGDLPRC
ncbi:MAG: hypothetical protein AB8G99_07475 [Planctomycetaceae bacterium]